MKFVVPEGIVEAFQSKSGKRVILSNPQSTGIFYAAEKGGNFKALLCVEGHATISLHRINLYCIDQDSHRYHMVREKRDLTFDGEKYRPVEVPSEFEYTPLPDALLPWLQAE